MLRLRPYKPSDAKEIVKWIKDERSFRLWCADHYESYPIGAEDIMAAYEKEETNNGFFPMTAFDETGIVGHLILRFTDKAQQILRFGFVIVNAEKRGKGYGAGMLRLALKYAFEILKVKKVTLGVFEDNPSAQRCYRAVGFKEVKVENSVPYDIMGEKWVCLEMAIDCMAYETFESEYCFVTYKALENVVYLSWKKFASFENYRQPTTFALELLRKYTGSNLIIDARNGFEDEKEDVLWGFSFLLPEMSRVGCEKVGMIMESVNNIEGEMNMWTKEFKKYFSIARGTSYEEVVEKLQ